MESKVFEIKNLIYFLKLNLISFSQHIYFQLFMAIITIYILFAEDIKLLCTEKDTDYIFSILTILCILIFAIEFFISVCSIDKYSWSFYFWLDLLSIIAMFLDVDWIYKGLIYGISGLDDSKSSANKNAKTLSAIFRAGRAAKIGSRAIRVLRIVRLLRLNNIYKNSEKFIEKKLKEKGNKNNNNQSESNVGKQLSELTNSRVIVLVLSMMIGILLFNTTFYIETRTSMDLGIRIFKSFNITDPNLNLTFNIYINEHQNISSSILYAQVGNLIYGDYEFTEKLRDDEKIIAFDECLNVNPDPLLGYVKLYIFIINELNTII